jgi:hypothetical protein
MTVKYSKWPRNIQNGHKIYQHFPFQGYPKFTKSRVSGMKICKPSGNPGEDDESFQHFFTLSRDEWQ